MGCPDRPRPCKADRGLQYPGKRTGLFGHGPHLCRDFVQAEEQCDRILELVDNSTYSEPKLLHLFFRCVLSNHRGDFDLALELNEAFQLEIKKTGLSVMSPRVFENLGVSRFGQGALDEAEKIANLYLDTAISLGSDLYKGLACRMLGLIHLHQGHSRRRKKSSKRRPRPFRMDSLPSTN